MRLFRGHAHSRFLWLAALLGLAGLTRAHAGETGGARPVFTEDMTPYQIYMVSENYIAPSGSREYVTTQERNTVSRSKDGTSSHKLEVRTVDRENWKDGFFVAWQHETVETFQSDGKTEVREEASYLVDGWVYKRNGDRKIKYLREPSPHEGVGVVEGYHGIYFAENMVASQSRHGNRLRFTLNPEAINEYNREIGYTEEMVSAAVEVELDDEGEVKKITHRSVGVQSDGTVRSESTASFVLETTQAGNVTPVFPPDLNSYAEIENR